MVDLGSNPTFASFAPVDSRQVDVGHGPNAKTQVHARPWKPGWCQGSKEGIQLPTGQLASPWIASWLIHLYNIYLYYWKHWNYLKCVWKNADVPLHKIWEFKPQHCDVAIFLIGVNLKHLPLDKEKELGALEGYSSTTSCWTSTLLVETAKHQLKFKPYKLNTNRCKYIIVSFLWHRLEVLSTRARPWNLGHYRRRWSHLQCEWNRYGPGFCDWFVTATSVKTQT